MDNNIITSAAIIATVDSIIRQQGGYREKSLLTAPREYRRAETWNNDHRVIEVIETTPDIDGYCHGCDVDIVTKSIVG